MLATNTPTGVAMYALLIILFTFFYTFVQINQRQKTFKRVVPISQASCPGKGTEEFINLRLLSFSKQVFQYSLALLPLQS